MTNSVLIIAKGMEVITELSPKPLVTAVFDTKTNLSYALRPINSRIGVALRRDPHFTAEAIIPPSLIISGDFDSLNQGRNHICAICMLGIFCRCRRV